MNCPWPLDYVCTPLINFWDGIFNPLMAVYVSVAIFIVVMGGIVYFLGWFKPVRVMAGLAVVGAVIYAYASRVMYKKMKKSNDDEEREARKPPEPGGDGWKFPKFPWEQ